MSYKGSRTVPRNGNQMIQALSKVAPKQRVVQFAKKSSAGERPPLFYGDGCVSIFICTGSPLAIHLAGTLSYSMPAKDLSTASTMSFAP